ncbi:KipI family sensor histidine kinase inhibitor [Dietzia sp. 2505]|uniref:5-oxoprolinase subunit B family protein n=1 Tax=Dietzia sp. 2505 TaxID=3156457 RepID=UPI0033993BF4
MTTTRIRRCGEAALLLDCADLAEAVELAGLVGRLHPEAVDVVAGARTVLVTARDASSLPALRRGLEQLLARDPLPSRAISYPDSGSGCGGGVADSGDAAGDAAEPVGQEAAGDAAQAVARAAVREVVLDVRYDGPDLADVADLVGASTEAFVRQHTSITWRAAFGGFAPGFFYLVDERELIGGAPEPHDNGGVAEPLPSVPRLGSPRPRVPAGSVGLADRFCAVYPGASPGGWRLIGSTDALLWDSDRPDPALLAPGDRVRFRAAGPRDVPR